MDLHNLSTGYTTNLSDLIFPLPSTKQADLKDHKHAVYCTHLQSSSLWCANHLLFAIYNLNAFKQLTVSHQYDVACTRRRYQQNNLLSNHDKSAVINQKTQHKIKVTNR